MPHSTGQQLSRCLLTVLAIASPLLAQGGEIKLAPVVDLNPRHSEAASPVLDEPKALEVAAEAVPLVPDTVPPTAPIAQPAVRAAAPFDPTAGTRSPQATTRVNSRQNTAKLAPVIRVYEPIRPAQNPRFGDPNVATNAIVEANEPTVTPPQKPDLVHRSVFLATRTDRLQRTEVSNTQPVRRYDMLSSRMLATLDSLARLKPMVSTTELIASQPDAEPQSAAASVPQRSGLIQVAERDPVAGLLKPSVAREQTFEVTAAHSERSSPVVKLATNPIIRQTPPVALPLIDAKESTPGPVLKLAEEILPQRLLPGEVLVSAAASAAAVGPVVSLADSQPLLAALQPSPSASDLPAPSEESLLTEEQKAVARGIEAFELDVKPINALSVRTKPEAGELPQDYASARFAREGEVVHRMGFSRATMETTMMWEAPASCHRPLYFEDINLERHGYKVPVIQPALSAAHFFGRVPLLPYMMVSEGHRKRQYTLGHYRPGDYAPYSLYVPRLQLDASAAEVAVAAGLILAFP